MNKEQQELLEEAYKNYLKNFTPPKCPPELDVQPDYYEPMSKEVFIYGIKTDDEFAKKWGLKIEERELSIEERQGILEKVFPMYYMDQQFGGEDIFTRNNIPTKLITITYNDKTIESYE